LKRENGIMVVQGITMINPVSTSQVPNSFSVGVVAIVELAHA
jgi:hypothetical protein